MSGEDCRCQIVGWTRDPYEPHIPSQPEWEQADDCPLHPLPAPVPSEVAETTAGEREDRPREPWEEYTADRWWLAPPTSADEPGGLHELARDNTFARAINFGIDDFRMGRQSNVALAESFAEAVLASDWLAAHDDRVRREEGERIAQAIEGAPDHTFRWSVDRVIAADIARAASVGRGEGQ